MKIKNIILVMVFLTVNEYVFAQCVNYISTNPKEPANNQFQSHLQANGGLQTSNVFLNKFDWMYRNPLAPTNFANILLNPQAGFAPSFTTTNWEMISPFSDQMLSEHGYLCESVFLEDRDGYWQDGWELLVMNIGYYPDGTPITDLVPGFTSGHHTSNPEMPYIIIYNRYRGVIRVFINALTSISMINYESAEIMLLLDNKKDRVTHLGRNNLNFR